VDGDPNPGDRSKDPEPHHALNSPAEDPDPTEHPDPYDKRSDPLAPGSRPQAGDHSTSGPHASEDPEAEPVGSGDALDG
jgi:hypothetical protein